MRNACVIKVMLLSALGLGSIGFSGGCGDQPAAQPGQSVPEDPKKTQDRMDFMKKQYENKAAAPSK